MNNLKESVVTRFAPSPTGFMHIGSVRTALYAYLYAKQHNGTFILRIEDTDKNREVDGSIDHIIESLQWLGMDWTYGPDKPGPFGACLQSDRLDIYKKYALELVEKGLAYPDPFTKEEIEQFREQATAEKRPFLFRNHRPKNPGTWDGSQPLRFKVPEIKRYEWTDTVRGSLSAGEEMLDDIIIMKADGFPTYNFAHIIDDHEMGVTHVMRGEEFIASTPKFLSLYDALNIPRPVFATLPPIMGPDGKKKLSKRDGAKDLLEYRAEGYLPDAMNNLLALTGWNPGGDEEVFTKEQLLEKFSLERIQRSGGAFNEEKLRWLNKAHLKHLTVEEKNDYFISALPEELTNATNFDRAKAQKITPVAFERITSKADINAAAVAGEYDWAFTTPEYAPELLHWKKDDFVTDALPRLQKVHTLLVDADFSSAESIRDAIWPYVESIGKGEVLWPLRTALSGQEKSPDPVTIAHILGREETLSRIKSACDKING